LWGQAGYPLAGEDLDAPQWNALAEITRWRAEKDQEALLRAMPGV
jgi:hypothetical protein